MNGVPLRGYAHHIGGDQKMDQVMNYGEAKRYKKARAGIIDIDLHPNRRRHVADNRFGDPENAQGLTRQSVLREANHSPTYSTGNWIPSRYRKENGHDQRNIKNLYEAKRARNVRLEKDSQERKADRRNRTKFMDFDLFARCISQRRHYFGTSAAGASVLGGCSGEAAVGAGFVFGFFG